MYQFEPPVDAEFFLMDKGVKYRRIFGEPRVFSSEEEQQIEEFKKYLEDNDLKLPENATDREMYRHLIVIKDHQETYDSIWEQYKFFKQIRPVNRDGLDTLMNSGIFYF